MGIKRLLANGFFGILLIATTRTAVVLAGNCLWYCDDQIEWGKRTWDEAGQPQTYRCTLYSDPPNSQFVYNDDSTFDKATDDVGTDAWKHYVGTSCDPTCQNVAYPVKASGSIEGEALTEGTDQKQTCTMENS